MGQKNPSRPASQGDARPVEARPDDTTPGAAPEASAPPDPARAEIERLRAQLDAQRAEFEAQWKAREAELAAGREAAPPAPKRRVAAASFRAPVNGELVEIQAGDPIPEGADLTGHPAWVTEEV